MNAFYAMNINHQMQQEHIIFRTPAELSAFKKDFLFQLPNQSISLCKELDNSIFQIMPKQFTITTNTGSCKFNRDMLVDTSSVILNFCKENPNNYEYHIDVDDDLNVLSKFKKLYEGEIVEFDENELFISQKITKILNLKCFPNFMKSESLKHKDYLNKIVNSQNPNSYSAQIDKTYFYKYLQKTVPKTFSIKTNRKVYNCNIFGVSYSNIIKEIIDKDPNLTEYKYDFDDEYNEFESIYDLFNFSQVKLTKENMNIINEIAEDLQITYILKDIEKFINHTEEVSQVIDEQQKIVDDVDDLFNLLYSIKEKTVDFVKTSIINSKWSKTKDNVQELAAFILQVIKADIILQPYIFDLLCQIDKESNKSKELNTLFSFITSILIYDTFGSLSKETQQNNAKYNINNNQGDSYYNMSKYAFIFKLYKNGIIQKDEMINNLKKYIDCQKFGIIEINLWFLPELVEICGIDGVQSNINKICIPKPSFGYFGNDKNNYNFIDCAKTFILNYLPDKIDLYKEMRDKEEPTDLLTKSLRNDDVDTLQSIVSTSGKDFSKYFVPFNLFENYIRNGNTTCINYAAAYGSLKCFKYLFLNHYSMDNFTFAYAAYGGNVEIIKIVQQHNNEININKMNNNPHAVWQNNRNSISQDDKIVPAIIKHRNDLFDWILMQTDYIDTNNKTILDNYLKLSIENGNAHSIIEIVDRGIDQKTLESYLLIAPQNGFYMITQLLLKLISKKSIPITNDINSIVNFGNISIFKLFQNELSSNQLENAITFAIKREYSKIVKYFFNAIFKDISSFLSYTVLNESIYNKSTKIFNYLFNQIKNLNPLFFKDNDYLTMLLSAVCKNTKNIEVAKILTELIIENDSDFLFTSQMFNLITYGSIEICKYFIDKKLLVDYEQLVSTIYETNESINEENLLLLVENLSPENQELFFNCLNKLIEIKNKKLVDYFLSKGASSDKALLLAVASDDIDLVNIVLKYNSMPSFINKRFSCGTALTVAVEHNNFEIFKRLLSLPQIDPFLFGGNNINPLIRSVELKDLKIFDSIIDCFSEKICQQKWMINEVIRKFVDTQNNMNQNNFNQNNFNQNNFNQNNFNPNNMNQNNFNQNNMNQNNFNQNNFNQNNMNQNYLIQIQNNNVVDEQMKNIKHILSRLLNLKCVDINYHYNCHTLLTYACTNNLIDVVDIILKYDNIDVNLSDSLNGDTPLIIAVKQNNFEIVDLLFQNPQLNVNIQNYDQQTALIIATNNDQDKIVDLIINNKNFDPIESRLNYSFFISKGELSNKFLSIESLDVNYLKPLNETSNNSEYSLKTPLAKAVHKNDIEKVKSIIKHPSFNKIKSQYETALKESILQNEKEIILELIKIIGNDINILKIGNKNLLEMAVINSNQEIISEILKNPHLNSKEIDIWKAFIEACTIIRENNNVLLILNILLNYDKEHDNLIDFNNLLPNGKSFYTSLNKNNKNNGEIARFFLDNGVDPNKPDSNGIFPLEYAFDFDSSDAALKLIDSNKIDFYQKIRIKDENDKGNPKFTSYLHLAVKSKNPEIIERILDKNLIDINCKNDLGDTPLIEACKKRMKNSVIILFECDFCNDNQELDFLHKNNKGEDALQIINQSHDSSLETINDKDEYLEKIIDLLN